MVMKQSSLLLEQNFLVCKLIKTNLKILIIIYQVYACIDVV